MIFTHAYALLGNIQDDPLYPLTGRVFSEIGVCGFFAISGYLIHTSLMRSSSPWSYARKRILRIFPGLAVVVLLSVLVLGPLAGRLPAGEYFSRSETWAYLSNMLLVPGRETLPGVFPGNVEPAVNGSLWTLRYELLFYALLGGMFFLGRRHKQMLIPLLIVLCLIMAFIVKNGLVRLSPLPQSLIYYTGVLGSYFLSGALLALYSDRLQQNKTAVLLVSSLVFFISLFLLRSRPQFLSILAFTAMVISLGLHYTPALQFSRYTGDISYGTYIYAYPVQQALIAWLQPQQVITLLVPSFLLSWLLGYLSWQLVERHFLKRRRAVPADTAGLSW